MQNAAVQQQRVDFGWLASASLRRACCPMVVPHERDTVPNRLRHLSGFTTTKPIAMHALGGEGTAREPVPRWASDSACLPACLLLPSCLAMQTQTCAPAESPAAMHPAALAISYPNTHTLLLDPLARSRVDAMQQRRPPDLR